VLGAFGRHYAHDLLPLPYTDEALAHVAERVRRVQDRLGRQILVENVSTYLTFSHSTMAEWTFLGAVAEAADCGILLDVNNIYVSAVNHGFAPIEYLAGLSRDRIGQVHLAGHSDAGTHLVDTTTTRCRRPCGRSIARRYGASGPSRRSSSGMITSRRSRKSSPRPRVHARPKRKCSEPLAGPRELGPARPGWAMAPALHLDRFDGRTLWHSPSQLEMSNRRR